MTGIVTTPGSWRNHSVGHVTEICEGKWKIIRRMGTMFWFVSSGLLLSAVANSNVTTYVSLSLSLSLSHTHTHTHIHTRTSSTSHVICLSHEIWCLNCVVLHHSSLLWVDTPCSIQTPNEPQRVTFGQELRHPHIVMLSRAFETCFPTSDSFYIEVIDPSYLFVITSTINKSQGQLLATTSTRNVRRRGGRLAK